MQLSVIEPIIHNSFNTIVHNNKLYVIGGFNGKPSNKVKMYDQENDSWITLSSFERERQNHSLVSYKDYIYLIGGRNIYYGDRLYDIQRYDVELNEWTQISYFDNINDGNYSITVKDGKLYFITGIDENINHIQVYDFRSDSFIDRYKIDTLFKYDNSIKVDNKIYLFDRKYPSRMDIYNIMKNEWDDHITYFHPRLHYTLCNIKNLIYVVGGYDGIVNYNDIYIYNTQMNIWTNGKDFQNNNKSYSVVILNDELYIIFEDTIDNGKKLRYDNGLNEWLFS